jgi:hypothetical protein
MRRKAIDLRKGDSQDAVVCYKRLLKSEKHACRNVEKLRKKGLKKPKVSKKIIMECIV